jgi:hypothetical protein
MASQAGTLIVEQDLYVEGFIISKHNGRNNETNEQVHFASLRNYDLSTGYIESVKGDVGFRIDYASRGVVSKFPRYAKVVLSLKGTTLVCEKPCRVTIKGISDANIVRLTQCSAEDLPRKAKYISEITDDDVYTYVTLRDCEILFRDGSFLNVYERYVQISDINKGATPNKTMDGWATLICDKKGSQIYVEGRLRTREWTDQQGNKRYTTEILADTMNLLGRRVEGGQVADNTGTYTATPRPAAPAQPAAQPQYQQPVAPAVPQEDPDDLPF